MITIFKHNKDKVNPKYSEVDKVLESIRACSVQSIVDKIRLESDHKKRGELKAGLPCILFSGKFLNRDDDSCVEHSGFAILDFDKLIDLKTKREELISEPFVYSVFVSPSGNGLKALVRIPASIQKHEGYYMALIKKFPEVDTTSKNIGRVCYASCDSDIYINKKAIEFTDYVEQVVKQIKAPQNYNRTDYQKAAIAAKIIQDSVKGEFHSCLVKASYLMGGFVAGGYLLESEAIAILESEISKKPIEDFKHAKKTIAKCLEEGKSEPIVDDTPITPIKHKQTSKVFTPELEFVSTNKDTEEYLKSHRDGTFKMGLPTGWKQFDKHWRFKPEHLVLNLGHDNVGKTIFSLFLTVISAVIHNWKWVIWTGENKTGFVKMKLMQFYIGKTIREMSDEEYIKAIKFVNDHYKIIKNEEMYNYADMLQMFRLLLKDFDFDAAMIDPYNGLHKKAQNEHQYDYTAIMEIRSFIKQTKKSVYINLHMVTEAVRRSYPKESEYFGHAMPPKKGDAEGGSKFANKADDFLVTHRLTQHESEWVFTQIHVLKIKESESGGRQTLLEEPIKLRLSPGGCGFEDMDGFNPVLDKAKPKYNQDKTIEPNREFEFDIRIDTPF